MTVEEKKVVPVVKEDGKSQRQREIEDLRKRRVPAGIPSMNLDFPTREGFSRRIVSDRPGRLEKFEKAGWRFVERDELEEPNTGSLKVTTREGIDSRVSQVIGSHKDGSPMVGYLMEIYDELYDEDQAVKMEKVDALEAGLREATTTESSDRPGTGRQPSAEGQYIPAHTGIKIDQKGRRG